jgi:hypothetical protein
MLGRGTLQLDDKWSREDAAALAERIRSIETDILNLQTETAALNTFGSTIIEYTQPTSSDVSTYSQALATPYATETSATTNSVSGEGVVGNWITDPSAPGIAFIPAGSFEVHLHAAYSGGTGLRQYQIYGELWETNSSGVDINKIGTSEYSNILSTIEEEFRMFFVTTNVYTMVSSLSRINLRVKLHIISGGSPNIIMFMGGEADAHFSLPTNSTGGGNFVPYTGANADVNLGIHTLDASAVSATKLYGTLQSTPISATDSSRLGGLLSAAFMSSGGFSSKARAYLPSGQVVSRITWTKMALSAENYDINSEFDSATNMRFVASAAGYYHVNGAIQISSLGTGNLAIAIYKNGAAYSQVNNYNYNNAGTNLGVAITDVVPLTGSEYIELYAYQDGPDATRTIISGSTISFMAIHRLS